MVDVKNVGRIGLFLHYRPSKEPVQDFGKLSLLGRTTSIPKYLKGVWRCVRALAEPLFRFAQLVRNTCRR